MPIARKKGKGPARLSAEEARQGRIVLRTPAQRAIFIGGLVGMILLALAVAVFWR